MFIMIFGKRIAYSLCNNFRKYYPSSELMSDSQKTASSDDGGREGGRYLVCIYQVSINLMVTMDVILRSSCTMQSRVINRSQPSSPFPNGQLIFGEYRISPILVPTVKSLLPQH